jgi:hypothetical protein
MNHSFTRVIMKVLSELRMSASGEHVTDTNAMFSCNVMGSAGAMTGSSTVTERSCRAGFQEEKA